MVVRLQLFPNLAVYQVELNKLNEQGSTIVDLPVNIEEVFPSIY
jgi:hypothetical protein